MRTIRGYLLLGLALGALLPSLAAADDSNLMPATGTDKFRIIIHVQPDNTVGMIEEQPPQQ